MHPPSLLCVKLLSDVPQSAQACAPADSFGADTLEKPLQAISLRIQRYLCIPRALIYEGNHPGSPGANYAADISLAAFLTSEKALADLQTAWLRAVARNSQRTAHYRR